MEQQAKMNQLLNKWLDNFKGKFGQYPEAQSTIQQVVDALKLYHEKVVVESYKVDLARAIEDRSVLEYGLDYHLPRFLEAVCILILTSLVARTLSFPCIEYISSSISRW